MRSLSFWIIALWLLGGICSFADDKKKTPDIFWPTPDAAYFSGKPLEQLLQPTASGKKESALFGCYRNHGKRFHEGLDLKPLSRDRNNEATDPIFAVMDGVVVYMNTRAGNSSYGRYLVLEHTEADIPVYTLYAHLSRVSPALKVGTVVNGGERIGLMGRSAGGYSIPRSRAHLHFEIGFLKSKQFDSWYRWRKISGKNHHGIHNGMNLIGTDPEPFFDQVRQGQFTSFRDYFFNLPTAYTLRVSTRRIPNFITRYPGLIAQRVQPDKLVGWDIEYTWYGLPKKWTPLTKTESGTTREGDIALLDHNPDLLAANCRNTLSVDKKGKVKLGDTLKGDLQLIFGFR